MIELLAGVLIGIFTSLYIGLMVFVYCALAYDNAARSVSERRSEFKMWAIAALWPLLGVMDRE